MPRPLLVLTALGLAHAAAADVAFSNLNVAPFPYDNAEYFDFSGGGLGFRFRSSASGTVTGLSLGINNMGAGAPIPYTASLYLDDAGTLGTPLGSFDGESTGHRNDDKRLSEANVAVGPSVSLTSGTDYWILVRLGRGSGWALASNLPLARGVSNGNYTDFFTQAATEVRVQSVPEPASLAALGLGVALLCRRRRALEKECAAALRRPSASEFPPRGAAA